MAFAKQQIPLMIYLIIYLLLALFVAFVSLKKRIGFTESLFISIALTPIVGLLIVLKTKANIQTHHYTMKHTCSTCGTEGAQNEKVCSNCGHEIQVSFNESKLSLA